jgi:hypothetical protein
MVKHVITVQLENKETNMKEQLYVYPFMQDLIMMVQVSNSVQKILIQTKLARRHANCVTRELVRLGQ